MSEKYAVEELYAMIRRGDIDDSDYMKTVRREPGKHLMVGTDGGCVTIIAADKAGQGQSTDFEVGIDLSPSNALEVAEKLIEAAEVEVAENVTELMVKNT